MTTTEQKTTSENLLDWPIILFFIIAYTIAWGVFALLGLIARQSGLDSAQTLLVMGESF